MPVSKTDFVRGTQCEKMLWLDSHRPELKIIPPEVQARLDAGNAFGDGAMSIFGAYEETTCYKADGRLDFGAMLDRTKTLLADGCPIICEGAFSWYGNYCAVDILRKTDGGYILYEVKNAPAVRKEFILDLGFQRLILYKCGVKIVASMLVLADGETDESSGQVCVERIEKDGIAYKIVDVTREAKILERQASGRVFELGKIKKKDAPIPPIGVGEHCEKPYPCWYLDYCKNKGSSVAETDEKNESENYAK